MASNLLIFLRINWPQCINSKATFGPSHNLGAAKFGGWASHDFWGPMPPLPQRGTATALN